MANGVTGKDRRFQYLSEDVGADIALFCFCAVFNIAYDDKIQFNTYEEYAALKRNTTFDEGEMNIKNVIRSKMSDEERWHSTWGTGGTSNPYTVEDYQRLDELFETYADRQLKAGGMDVQAEYVLRSTCQDQLFAEKCRSRGTKEDIQMYTQINKTIQDRLAAEQMRKKDEKAVEEVKIDSIVAALEKAGLARRGKLLSLEEVQEQLLRRLGALGGEPSHKYPYTIDAADQMLHMIQNNMYANDGLPEMSEIPDNLRFDDNVAPEFTYEPNEKEQEAYKKMGLVREHIVEPEDKLPWQ